MRPRDLIAFLVAAIRNCQPALVVGQPGAGKTDIVAQAARAAGAELIACHPAVEDPTDIKGLPAIAADGNSARWLPYGILHAICSATAPTVLNIEDLGQATPATQAGYMQVLLARRIGEHAVSPHVTFIATTNRRTDRAGVSGILEPVKDRFVIVDAEMHVDDWSAWAIDNNVPAVLIACVRLRPEMLTAWEPTGDIANSCTPRGLARAGRVLSWGLSPEVLRPALAGCVGAGAAGEILSFVAMAHAMPSIDALLLDPERAPIPSRMDALYAVATGVAARAADARFAPIARYTERLVEAGRAEFAALLLRDALRRAPAIAQTAEFVRLATGPLAEVIGGTAG